MIKIEEILLQGDPVTIKATGRSMRPTFRDGKDFVTITPCDVDDLQVGDVVFFDRGDQYCLHRIIEINGDNLVIRGDGNRPQALEKVKRDAVVGKVTAGTMNGGREFEISDRIWTRNTERVMRHYPMIAFYHRCLDVVLHYPLSILVLSVLMYLSFMNTETLASVSFQGADKWVHVVMYLGVSSVFWFEWMKVHIRMGRRDCVKGMVFCFVIPIILGGLIEIAQEHLTRGMRSGDIYDFIADVIGTVIALAFSFAVSRPLLKYLKKKRI